MQLTDREKEMLDGQAGEAVRLAMSILTDIGGAVEAQEMTEIVHVHADSGFYLGDAGLEFVEHLAELEGKVSVPTTMNNTSFDLERAISYGVSQDLFDKIKRIGCRKGTGLSLWQGLDRDSHGGAGTGES